MSKRGLWWEGRTEKAVDTRFAAERAEDGAEAAEEAADGAATGAMARCSGCRSVKPLSRLHPAAWRHNETMRERLVCAACLTARVKARQQQATAPNADGC